MVNRNASNKLLLVYAKTTGIAVWANEEFAFMLRNIFMYLKKFCAILEVRVS